MHPASRFETEYLSAGVSSATPATGNRGSVQANSGERLEVGDDLEVFGRLAAYGSSGGTYSMRDVVYRAGVSSQFRQLQCLDGEEPIRGTGDVSVQFQVFCPS